MCPVSLRQKKYSSLHTENVTHIRKDVRRRLVIISQNEHFSHHMIQLLITIHISHLFILHAFSFANQFQKQTSFL